MSRSILRTLAAASVAALALAGCSGGSGGSGDGTLGFYTDKAAWETSFDDMNSASEGNGLQLDFTGYSDTASYDSFIKNSFRTNESPDLFTWHTGPQLEELVDEGLIAETTELWDEAEANGDVPEGLKDNFTVDGKQYCVPLNNVYWSMYYNKHVFAEHGLEEPESWEDLVAIAETLIENDQVPFHQMNIVFEFVWFQALLTGTAPEVYEGLQTGDASYTDPEVVAVMEQWKQMIDDGYFVDPGVTTDPQTLLTNGDVAMAYFGTFFTGQLTDAGAVSGEDYGIFTLPVVDPGVENPQMVVETGPLCVGAGSENEEQALEYSAWWFTEDAQTAWADSRGDLPLNPKVDPEDPELKKLTDEVNDPDNGYVLQKRYLEATPVPVYTVSTEVFGDFVTNAPEPAEGLAQLQKAADAYWAEDADG